MELCGVLWSFVGLARIKRQIGASFKLNQELCLFTVDYDQNRTITNIHGMVPILLSDIYLKKHTKQHQYTLKHTYST